MLHFLLSFRCFKNMEANISKRIHMYNGNSSVTNMTVNDRLKKPAKDLN